MCDLSRPSWLDRKRSTRQLALTIGVVLIAAFSTVAHGQQPESPAWADGPQAPTALGQPVDPGVEHGDTSGFPILARPPETYADFAQLTAMINQVIRAIEARQAIREAELAAREAVLAEQGNFADVAQRIAELESSLADSELRSAYDRQRQRIAESIAPLLHIVVADPPPEPDPTEPPTNEALRQPDNPELFRRILTLPDARLLRGPGGVAVDNQTLPTFSVRYVYQDVDGWLQVGRDPHGWIDGWLPQAETEEWRHMLVMEFAPPGPRGRVFFFNRLEDLAGAVRNPASAQVIRSHLQQIDEGELTDQINAYYAAVEPRTSVDRNSSPYLLPILDWQRASFLLPAEPTTLVQVAGLNAVDAAPPPEPSPIGGGQVEDTSALADLRIGVVFVIDTTTSMRPYVNQVRETILTVYEGLRASGFLDNAAFGLIGYRDNIAVNPRIEYVTRTYQELELDVAPERLLVNLGNVAISPVSTEGWNEDAYAGMIVGLGGLGDIDWEPFDLRLVMLISDAGPRPLNDPRAQNPLIGSAALVEMAQRNDIVVIPVHFLTDEAARHENHNYARLQYTAFDETGISYHNNYIGLSTNTEEIFDLQLSAFAENLIEQLTNMAEGRPVQPPVGGFCIEALEAGGCPEYGPEPTDAMPVDPDLSSVFTNELFRAQLEFLGARHSIVSPRFTRAWASDRDLTNPSIPALEVKVYLTRRQVHELAQRLQEIVNVWLGGNRAPREVFGALQQLAATTALAGGGGQQAPETIDQPFSEVLPSYLRALPYRSDILQLAEQDWSNLGIPGREALMNELQSKLEIYSELVADTAGWQDLGAGNPDLEVYALSLDLLP